MRFIWFHVHSIVLHRRRSEQKQGIDLEVGADAEAMEECCLVLLTGSLWFVQPAFL